MSTDTGASAATSRLLANAQDASSRAALFALIYGELKQRAQRILAGHRSSSLNATALVHEAYIKLLGSASRIDGREHFFRIAAQAMRQIMVDHARHHLRDKRDQRLQVTLDDAAVPAQDARLVDLLGLDSALQKLHGEAVDLADLVELHFFGGMKFAEIAQLRGVSLSTVEREWRLARAALYGHMQ